MNDNILLSVIIIIILLLLSGFFSATETAYSSLNEARLKTMADKGDARAAKALRLSQRYDELLSTILVGNNVVNIAMSSVGTLMFIRLLPKIGATVSTIVITVVVLIFGEISPKSLAKERPESFAMRFAAVMQLLIWILTPVNRLFSLWKQLLGRVFHAEDAPKLTQDELLTLVEEAAEGGGIDEDEGELLRSALEFTDLSADDILTPRADLEAVELTAPKAEIARLFSSTQYSRLPVYDGDIDHIVGVLHLKDFYTGSGISSGAVSELMREPVYVPPSVRLPELLNVLRKHQAQVAVITDEYGGTSGIVTMEDILEELVGEIWDEHDEVIEIFRRVSGRVTRVLCSASLDEFEDYFGVTCGSDSATVGGWVTEELGRIPDAGDRFTRLGLDITVTAVEEHRVSEIEVTVPEEKEN